MSQHLQALLRCRREAAYTGLPPHHVSAAQHAQQPFTLCCCASPSPPPPGADQLQAVSFIMYYQEVLQNATHPPGLYFGLGMSPDGQIFGRMRYPGR